MKLMEEFVDVYLQTLKYLPDVISEPSEEFNLSFEQYLILKQVTTKSNVTLTDIVEKRQVTRAAISRQINRLVSKGFVNQENDMKDHRRMFLRLTEKGELAEKTITKRVERGFDSWVNTFGKQRMEDILDFIKQFGNTIETNKY